MLLNRKNASTLDDKIIQFGEGNFLRGFVDWMIDKLNKETGFNGGVTIVQPIENGTVDLLNNQDCLYTLVLRGLQKGETIEQHTIIECVKKGINPYTHWDSYINLAKNPSYRFIISNTTESGIEYKKESIDSAPYITFPAKLTLLLKKRFDLGLNGFVIMPCELIDFNGNVLKECVLKYADDWNFGESFAKWVNEKNFFTNTLVDRIVTGYPRDDVEELQKMLGYEDNCIDTAEIFHLWVIEGNKEIANEIPFHKIGLNVLWTDDVTPYKIRKVRILNGAHTMMVPAAHMAGLETVKDAMDDDLIAGFMKQGIFEEIIPTLDLTKEELVNFANDVLERFSNPFIKHYLLSISLNSVSKFKVRVLPSILEYINRKNIIPTKLIFSFAALIAFYKTDFANDDKDIIKYMKNADIREILKNIKLWGQDLSMLEDSVQAYYDMIKSEGVRNALRGVMQ